MDRSLCWLFVDLKGSEGAGPLEGLHPTWVNLEGDERVVEGLAVPERLLMKGPGRSVETQEEWYEIAEWLDLAAMGSERLMANADVDANISRYRVLDRESAKTTTLRLVRWEGLLSSIWITKLLIEVTKQSRIAKAQQWLSISITSHRTDAVGQIDGYAIVLQPSEGREEQVEQRNEDVQMASSTQKEKAGGLQSSMCFQYVDSNTAG